MSTAVKTVGSYYGAVCLNSIVRDQAFKPFEFLSWGIKKQLGAVTLLWPLGVAFIFIPPCDPLLFLQVIVVFFISDLSLFFRDLYSLVSGNAFIVPRAFEESTLEKRER